MIHLVAKLSEQGNNKCSLGTRFLQLSALFFKSPTLQISKFYLFIMSCFVDHMIILFTLMQIAGIVHWWQSIVIMAMTGVRSSAISQWQLRFLLLLRRHTMLSLSTNCSSLLTINCSRKLNTTQLMFFSHLFRTAHRHLMTSDLAPMINFCLTKLHILMIVNLSFACSTETATDYFKRS